MDVPLLFYRIFIFYETQYHQLRVAQDRGQSRSYVAYTVLVRTAFAGRLLLGTFHLGSVLLAWAAVSKELSLGQSVPRAWWKRPIGKRVPRFREHRVSWTRYETRTLSSGDVPSVPQTYLRHLVRLFISPPAFRGWSSIRYDLDDDRSDLSVLVQVADGFNRERGRRYGCWARTFAFFSLRSPL